MSLRDSNAAAIRDLNNRVRAAGPATTKSVRWLLTSGVQALGPDLVSEAVRSVMAFTAFDRDNDPHGEHDFGAFSLAGERLFWKIDYYNRDLDGGSPDPANESVTSRVLTIMLTSEY